MAYEKLEPDMKKKLRELKAKHLFYKRWIKFDENGLPCGMSQEQVESVPEVVSELMKDEEHHR